MYKAKAYAAAGDAAEAERLVAPLSWDAFRFARALVMSRSYSVPGVGHVLLPGVCFANHDDERFNALDPVFAGAAAAAAEEEPEQQHQRQ